MSETVTYKGKLQKIVEGKVNIENWCREFIIYTKNSDIKAYYENYTPLAQEVYYDEIIIINDMLFKIISQEKLSNDDIFEIKDLGNGNFEYLVQFYDGGCSFYDAIEQSFKNLNK